MYAIVKTGGKQFRVSEGQRLKVEKLEASVGDSLEMGEVLLIDDGKALKVGRPTVDGGKVMAEVLSHGRGDKIRIEKFRRRKHYRRQMGHRQWFTELKVTGISF